MIQALLRLKLPALILLSAWLGYLSLATPEVQTIRLADGASTIAFPRSLEGWKVTAGEGNILARGTTRLNIIALEIETTGVPVIGPLAEYISDRHSKLWQQETDYQIRLKGELRDFGRHRAPISRAVFAGTFMGIKTRMVQHDAYLTYKGEYVRIGLRFPEFLDEYTANDQIFIANNIQLGQ
ncbi:MAG TPA: hypothetical protein VD902_13670 [Symbiobacteriaceae bacterium]|nr:hypothetical protein [Symbiobacteriaceae bacterium]